MLDIVFSDKIRNAAPALRVIQIEASVTNAPTSDELWSEIEAEMESLGRTFSLQDINKRDGIRETRMAYKALGKEPNRYRPSAEALCRRIVNGKGLYRTTTLIDAINLVSIMTGYSIGGFDLDKVAGHTLTLDAGTREDTFHAIGRGLLNIEGLPVYRDNIGGIGTPTSDEERTKLSPSTRRLLMLVNIYGESMPDMETVSLIQGLLLRHAYLSDFRYKIISQTTI